MDKNYLALDRTTLVIIAVLLALCLAHIAPAPLAAEELSQQELTRLRHEARHRQRRIIVNNDGCDTRYGCKNATAEDLLAVRTSPLVGTQVDTIFYCTNGGFNLFWHDTKVAEVYTGTQGSHKDNKMQKFLDRGLCPLRIIVDFCKANNIEVFWSLRMNDIHDSVGAWFSPLLYSQFKKDNPDLLVCDPKAKTKKWGWTAMDYSRREVRDQVLAIIREVCENYDIDGIELDYFRHLIVFKSPAAGKDASREEQECMTHLVREVRKTVDEAGRRRGRPILVAVRVPDSLDYCRALGLDVERWMKDDLIDLFIPGGDFCLNPWQPSVELGHRYGIPVYPCLSRFERNNNIWRARAMNAWHSGADGIYTFNLFDPHLSLWRQMGDPQTLRATKKIYCGSHNPTFVRKANSCMLDASRFSNRNVLTPRNPKTLTPGKEVVVPLLIGERIEPVGDPPVAPHVAMRLSVRGRFKPEDIIVQVNGQPLSAGDAVVEKSWIKYTLDPKLLVLGNNDFTIKLNQSGKNSIKLPDLRVSVSYQ